MQYTGPNGAMAEGLLNEYLTGAAKRNAWFVGTGDYIDFMSPSNRAKLKAAGFYDTALDVVSDKALSLTQELYDKYLVQTRGQWLGLVHGHHWSELANGSTTDEWLAERLECPYLGTSAYIVLNFESDDLSQRAGRVVLWVHHGRGNGRASAPINKLETVATYWDADVFVIGHMSKLAAAPINRIYPAEDSEGNLHLAHRKIQLVGAGSWSRAYMEGHRQGRRKHGCYVEEAMMNPAALGGCFVKVIPRWESRKWVPTITVEV
jgi:hypothetical protein